MCSINCNRDSKERRVFYASPTRLLSREYGAWTQCLQAERSPTGAGPEWQSTQSGPRGRNPASPLPRVRPLPLAHAARYVPWDSDPAWAAAARPISEALTGWLSEDRRGLGSARTWTGRPASRRGRGRRLGAGPGRRASLEFGLVGIAGLLRPGR